MSIRRFLLLSLIAIIVLIIFSAAVRGYQKSMQQATQIFDDNLIYIANIIDPTQLQYNNKTWPENLAIQLWQGNQLLFRTANTPSWAISVNDTGVSEQNFNHQRWRVLSQLKGNYLLLVAQPTQQRYALAEQLILTAVMPIIYTIPLLALFIWWVTIKGLAPLKNLSKQLAKKQANDLSPIEISPLASELQTVVNTINHLFVRLDNAFEREHRFAADAAHELRTPLSVLTINMHNAALEFGDNETMQELKASVDRMAHVIDQILILHRTCPEQFNQTFTTVNLNDLTQQVVQDCYPQLTQQQQQIELVRDQTCTIVGDQFSLELMLRNLVMNASKYSGTGSNIKLTLVNNGNIELWVEDSGPGIPETERNRVFERFYRVGGDQHQSQVVGCGLGLAIVKHIIELHQAQIQLESSTSLGGLAVHIQFNANLN